MSQTGVPPLVAHIVYSFHIGGLENGVVNLINHMPEGRYRHVIIALADMDAAFCERIKRSDVEFISLHKPPGHGIKLFARVYRLLRRLRPAIVHTRNLAALEMVVPAWFARVPVRIHGEHGWDAADPDGRSRKYALIRRLYAPFVTHYIALSAHLSSYLTQRVGIAPPRVTRICNGVDVDRFGARTPQAQRVEGMPAGFDDSDAVIFGTVGRLQPVKGQLNLVRALAFWRASGAPAAGHARLMLVGDGPTREQVEAEVRQSGLAPVVWLAGARSDVPALMRSMDCFVLPSLAEGISNTLLEAMASAVPTIATRVGGNAELVDEGRTGLLVEAGDPEALADAMARLGGDPELRARMGACARQRATAQFSLQAMVDQYVALYDGLLEGGCSERPATTKS